jgi:methionyl-tRNA formyltransferase
MALRIVFMGTPDFAVPTLAEIMGAGHDVVAAYSQPPRAAGRGMAERKSPVQTFAETAGIPVLTPVNFKGEAERAAFAAHEADAAVVVAYGLLLPKAILEAPREGCLNLHPSKLPRWRGAAPINRPIMAGDDETAVMVMRMDQGLDTGPVCIGEAVPIPGEATYGDMHDELARRGAQLMVRALSALERGTLDCQPQSEDGVTYARKIDKAEARIDFSAPAKRVHDLIRGLSPFPGAWFEVGPEGKRERIKVLRAVVADGSGEPGVALDDMLTIACGEGAVRFVELQRAGKKPMPAAEVLRGFSIPARTRLPTKA